ncbi:MAG: hypothetical protein M1416_01895 [Candidatus Pacearchaeota archaeon]|nr:hypothetical protein [Candidatus Pacearchaeota archaeon]
MNIDDKIKNCDGKLGEIPASDENYTAKLKLRIYETAIKLNTMIVRNEYLIFPITMSVCRLAGM